MTVSTHVLDASIGRPVAGLAVTLFSLDGPAAWTAVESAATDADGRYRFGAETAPGTYRLTFDTGAYFEQRAVLAFYPEVTITFTVTGGHFHVPLLLSPFAYSTYRGS
jgi:5-hydroxyisourate hydrolase